MLSLHAAWWFNNNASSSLNIFFWFISIRHAEKYLTANKPKYVSKIRKVYAELNDRNAVTQKRPEYIAKIRIVHAENDRNEMHQIGQNLSPKSEIYIAKTVT